MKCLDVLLMSGLLAKANASTRLRQHHNLHDTHDDPCHRLVVAMVGGSYIQPHRHKAYPKEELFVVLSGELVAVTFLEDGTVETVQMLTPGGTCVGCEFPAGAWHTIVALKESVFLEVKAGPYMPLPDDDRAPWAPVEGDPAARSYLEGLRGEVGNWLRR